MDKTPIPHIPYEMIREDLRPGDVLFFGPRPFRSIHSLADLGGYISNQVIRLGQYPGSGHLGWHNAIHVETVFYAEIAGAKRWLAAGYTNKRNAAGGGIHVTAMSWRARYPGMLLRMSVRDELRTGLTNELIYNRVVAAEDTPYGAENLLESITHRPDDPVSDRPYCVSWVLGDILVPAGVGDDTELMTDGRDVYTTPLVAGRYSVTELIRDYKTIWDRSRAAIIV